MNTKNNERAKATRNSIVNVFLLLLEKKDISKITVREICERAKINRSTFYTHYLDVYDLMDQIEESIAENLLANFLQEPQKGILHGFTLLFTCMRENTTFYKAYLENAGNHFQERMRRITEANCSAQLTELYTKLKTENERELRYQITIFASGVQALLHLWLSDGCPESPEELAKLIQRHYTRFWTIMAW